MGASDTYSTHVANYLRSSAGRDTPLITAARLFALGPGQLGMSRPPTPAQLHTTRQLFDRLGQLAQIPDQLDLDESGAWPFPCAAIHVA